MPTSYLFILMITKYLLSLIKYNYFVTNELNVDKSAVFSCLINNIFFHFTSKLAFDSNIASLDSNVYQNIRTPKVLTINYYTDFSGSRINSFRSFL